MPVYVLGCGYARSYHCFLYFVYVCLFTCVHLCVRACLHVFLKPCAFRAVLYIRGACQCAGSDCFHRVRVSDTHRVYSEAHTHTQRVLSAKKMFMCACTSVRACTCVRVRPCVCFCKRSTNHRDDSDCDLFREVVT